MKKYGLFLLLLATPFFGVENRNLQAYRYLEDTSPDHLLQWAQIAYEQEAFGTALLYLERARNLYSSQEAEKYQTLRKLADTGIMQQFHDNLLDIYAEAKKRHMTKSVALLDELFLTHPPQSFDNSLKKVLAFVQERNTMPELDVMTGRIYQIQGEYAQAHFYYQHAWENRTLFAIPEQRFEVLYALAEIAHLNGDADKREQYLLLILTEDPIYGRPLKESAILKAMINTLKHTDTTEKFFILYRNNNPIALSAYHSLTSFYLETQNTERALATASLAASIAITQLDNFLHNELFTYQYTDLSNLLISVGENTALAQWALQHDVWNILLQFGDVLLANGLRSQAQSLFYTLAEKCPSFESAKQAAYKFSLTL